MAEGRTAVDVGRKIADCIGRVREGRQESLRRGRRDPVRTAVLCAGIRVARGDAVQVLPARAAGEDHLGVQADPLTEPNPPPLRKAPPGLRHQDSAACSKDPRLGPGVVACLQRLIKVGILRKLPEPE